MGICTGIGIYGWRFIGINDFHVKLILANNAFEDQLAFVLVERESPNLIFSGLFGW